MAEVEVKNLKNEVVEKLQLLDEVFNYTKSETLVWEAVKAYLAARRKGTHATKNRAAVRGAGKKLWRQKGTGQARIGSIRSPLRRKGGTVFGPQPRDYDESFPRRKRRGAVKMVLTDKLLRDKITVVDEFALETHRTRDFAAVLKTLGTERTVLVVDRDANQNLALGSRNLPGVKTVRSCSVNVYDLLRHERLLISKSAVLDLQEVLQR